MTYCYPDLINNSALNQVLQHQQTTQPGCLCLEKFASNLRNALILVFYVYYSAVLPIYGLLVYCDIQYILMYEMQ